MRLELLSPRTQMRATANGKVRNCICTLSQASRLYTPNLFIHALLFIIAARGPLFMDLLGARFMDKGGRGSFSVISPVPPYWSDHQLAARYTRSLGDM